MNRKSYMIIFMITMLLGFSGTCQEDGSPQDKVVEIQIGDQYKKEDEGKTEKYKLKVPTDKIPKQKSWFLFIELEPTESSTVLGTASKISFQVEYHNGNKKDFDSCQISEEWSSCFLTNRDFDPEKDNLFFTVYCPQSCLYSLSPHFQSAIPLIMGKRNILDFQDSQYSQIFRLDTGATPPDQVQIILEPLGWLRYPEPINLYANWGDSVPTASEHDLRGVNIWNDGLGIFVNHQQIKTHNKLLTILVEGPQRNILKLTTKEVKNKDLRQLSMIEANFGHILKGQEKRYVAELKEDEGISHNFGLITITGALQSLQFQNPDKNNEVLPSVQTQGDFSKTSYHLSYDYVQKYNLSKIILVIKGKKNSTYIIQAWETNHTMIPLSDHISESSIMQKGQIDQYFIGVEEYLEKDKKQKSSKIEIYVHAYRGQFKIRFFSCLNYLTEKLKKCEISKQYLSQMDKHTNQFEELEPYKTDESVTKHTYGFDIDWEDKLRDSENEQDYVMGIVVVVQNQAKGQTAYEIQYRNRERIHPLIEGDLFIDRTYIGQSKIYQLSFDDPDIQQVRAHITQISGKVKVEGSFKDPRFNKQFKVITPTHNILYFPIDNNKTKSIYLKVTGIDDCLFSIMPQIMRGSESDTTKQNSTGYNQLIISESYPYELLIEPGEKMVLQIRNLGKKFNIHMKSSLPLEFCGTENFDKPPFKPNCEVHEKSLVFADQSIILERGQVANIGITNNNDEKVDFKIQISRDEALCQIAPMGHTMEKVILKNGEDQDGDSYHCLLYSIHKAEDLEVNVKVDNGVYTNPGEIMIKFGDEEVEMVEAIHKFSKEQIESLCPELKNGRTGSRYCYMEIKIKNLAGTKIHVLVQYTDQMMKLMDGFAHRVHSKMVKNQPKVFYYNIINRKETIIFLENKAGEYKIYANVITNKQFEEGRFDNSSKIIPNSKNNQFQSSNPFYYLEQTIVVSDKDINKYCDKNSLCVLMIAVELTGDQEVKQNGKFIIQCTQESRVIEERQVVQGYLPDKSVDFFLYKNIVENGSIIVSINNQNKKCLNIYINNGTQRATISNNLKSVKASNELIVENASKDIYSITLQANDHCRYTLEVSTTQNFVATIKKGLFTDVEMSKNQVKYLVFENLIDERFRVVSLHKKGELTISIKPLNNSLELNKNKSLNKIKGYVWVNQDSVRVDNVTATGKPHQNYCYDCFYLIKLEASRKTESSIMIPTPNIEIPLKTDAIMKDSLQQKQQTTYRIFTDSESSFELHVLYGKIKITIIDSQNQSKPAFQKTFEESLNPITEKFSLTSNKDYEFLRYSRIKVQAIKESFFSFGVISDEDPDQRGENLKYGMPHYLFVQKNKQVCVGANIDRYDDNFLLSFDKLDPTKVDDIQIVLTKDGKKVDFRKQVGRNQMVLSFSLTEPPSHGQYQLCLKNKQYSFSTTVVQSSPVIYFPPQKSIPVKGQLNMTFMSEGKSIIEINQCRGRMQTRIFSQFSDLRSDHSNVKQIRRRNNIVQFYYYGPIFAHFESTKGSVKWFPYNKDKQIGMGYEIYEAGWLRVKKSQDILQILAEPIKEIGSNNNTIRQITYIGYAGREEDQLLAAMNCFDNQFMTLPYVSDKISKETVIANFSLQSLRRRFEDRNYFLVSIKAEIQLINQEKEREYYRFYYPYQEITQELLEGDDEWEQQEDDDDEGGFFDFIVGILSIILLVAFVVGVLMFCYKKFLNRRGRLSLESQGTELGYTGFSNTR